MTIISQTGDASSWNSISFFRVRLSQTMTEPVIKKKQRHFNIYILARWSNLSNLYSVPADATQQFHGTHVSYLSTIFFNATLLRTKQTFKQRKSKNDFIRWAKQKQSVNVKLPLNEWQPMNKRKRKYIYTVYDVWFNIFISEYVLFFMAYFSVINIIEKLKEIWKKNSKSMITILLINSYLLSF